MEKAADGTVFDDTESDEPDVVLGHFQPLSLTEACNSLPSRPVVDRLLSKQFNARYLHIREFWSASSLDTGIADKTSLYPPEEVLERGLRLPEKLISTG